MPQMKTDLGDRNYVKIKYGIGVDDEYFLFNIELNGNQMFQMNIREHDDINEAVSVIMQKLKQLI